MSDSRNKIKSFNHWALIVFLSMPFFYSCSSYQTKMDVYYGHLKAHQYEKALKSMEANKFLNHPRNILLKDLEAGRLQMLNNNPQKSNEFLNAADALLVHLRKDPLFEITIPSKTQAYMAVGKPLLMAVNGDAADLVFQSGGGVVAESENAQALATSAHNLSEMSADELRTMGRKAKIYYQEQLSLQVGVSKFAVLFKQLASKGK